MRGAWALSLLLAGCAADIPEGRYHCATDTECPDGWSCGGGLCWSTPRDAGALEDADVTDAGGADAEADADAGAVEDGGAACDPDRGEPNEGLSAAQDAGRLAVDSSRTLLVYGLHDASDEDWFSLQVSEGGTTGGGLLATVALSRIPAGSDYDLAAFFECNGLGEKRVSCEDGTFSNAFGDGGCVSARRDASTETVQLDITCGAVLPRGTLYLRVTSFAWGGSCEPYSLEVDLRGR